MEILTLNLAVLLVLVIAIAWCVSRARPAATPWAAGILLTWLAIAYGLATRGWLAPASPSPLPLGSAIVVPLLLGALALTRHKGIRSVAMAIPQTQLVMLHLVRLIGGLFLYLWTKDELPGSFALSAGIGDIAVALTAPWVAWMLVQKRPNANKMLWAWNIAGVLDFSFAVALGALSSTGPQRLFFSGVPADALASLPLSLIPTFGVPLVALLHMVSIMQLRGSASGGRA